MIFQKYLHFYQSKDKLFFFSATFSNEIKNLALEFLNNPVNIEVEDEEQNIIKQVFYEVNSRDLKDNLIEKLIKKY